MDTSAEPAALCAPNEKIRADARVEFGLRPIGDGVRLARPLG